MCSWANFYQGLANEARQRAARASNPSIRDNSKRCKGVVDAGGVG